MSLPLVVRAAAQVEMLDARDWYEILLNEKFPGLVTDPLLPGNSEEERACRQVIH